MRLKMVRWPVVPVLLAVLVLATGSVAVAEGSRSAPGVAAAPQVPVGPMPGTDPAMQRWFLAVDKARIAFNNVLLRAEADIAGGAGAAAGRSGTAAGQAAAGQAGTANCSALVAATALITKVLPALRKIPAGGAAVADAYGPSLDAFSAAGQACVKQDFAGAKQILGDTTQGAIAAYGLAQEEVDEILDAGA
jgi:hypothetical protein